MVMACLKLKPNFKSSIWGGEKLKNLFNFTSKDNIAEAWCASINPFHSNIIENGEYKNFTFQEYLKLTNSDCTIMTKFINSAQNLSVQVHPDDKLAKKLENQDSGKSEFWYVISADNKSFAYCGFNKDLTPQEFLQRQKQGSLFEVMNKFELHEGDCVFVPARTIHCIGKGLTILEISQHSDLTYRIFDFKRKQANGKERELHLENALQSLNFKAIDKKNFFLKANNTFRYCRWGQYRHLIKCSYFSVFECKINKKMHFFSKNNCILNFLSGFGTINGQKFNAGDTFFVTQFTNLLISGKCRLIVSRH